VIWDAGVGRLGAVTAGALDVRSCFILSSARPSCACDSAAECAAIAKLGIGRPRRARRSLARVLSENLLY
jgi:hypothetical protein